MYEKKSQGALEFLMIFIFVLIIVSAVIYIVGLVSIDISNNKDKKEILNFAENIINEYNFAQKLEKGYYREEFVFESTNPRFEVIINQTYKFMTIKDLETPRNETVFYHEFSKSDVEISMLKKDSDLNGVNETYVVLHKPDVLNYNGLDITSNPSPLTPFTATIASLTVNVINSNSCPVGFIKLYAFQDNQTTAHAEIPSQNNYLWSVCIKHDTYSLGTSNGAISERMFYLGDVTNSHIWRTNSSAHSGPFPYNWQELYINSSGGIIDIDYSTSRPSLEHSCIASFNNQDDVYGRHILSNSNFCNNADPYEDLWLKVE